MRANEIDLNLIVALDMLLHERNVTRAAERLYLGQPAMSAALARLRLVFDDPLLVRSGRIMTPTPLALVLEEPVHNLLSAIEEVFTMRADFDPVVAGREFTLMASDYATLVLIRQVLESLDTDAPKLRVTIQPLTPNFGRMLQRGEVDFLVVPSEIDPILERQPHRELFEDRFVCVVSEGNPEVAGGLSREVFAQLPQLAYSGGLMQSLADRWLDEIGVERNIEATTQTFVLAPLLIRGTRLAAVTHERVAAAFAPISGCQVFPLPFALPMIHETLYWHPRFETDPAHRWLRERIAAVAATIA